MSKNKHILLSVALYLMIGIIVLLTTNPIWVTYSPAYRFGYSIGTALFLSIMGYLAGNLSYMVEQEKKNARNETNTNNNPPTS